MIRNLTSAKLRSTKPKLDWLIVFDEEKANFLDRPEIKDGLKKARLLYDERGN